MYTTVNNIFILMIFASCSDDKTSAAFSNLDIFYYFCVEIAQLMRETLMEAVASVSVYAENSLASLLQISQAISALLSESSLVTKVFVRVIVLL